MTSDQALKILGLDASASEAQVKEAYRDLAKVWHPDRFGDDARLGNKAQERLKEINEACRVLKSRQWRPQPSGSAQRPPRQPDRPPDPAPRSSPPRPSPHTEPVVERTKASLFQWNWSWVIGALLLVGLWGLSQSRPPESEPSNLVQHSATPSAPGSPDGSLTPPASAQRSEAGESAPLTSAPAARPAPLEGFFTVGSSKDEVLAVQGTPTEFHDSVWKYGYSSVTFTNGRVAGWEISSLNELKARLLPSGPVAAGQQFFTVGSTKDDVLAVQGSPTEFDDRVWKYGYSSVFFQHDRVTNWDISSLNRLQVRMLPSGPVDEARQFFSVGSTKDEVLAVQGTPTEFNESVWKYGYSSVTFRNGRVATWDISSLNPLRARMQ